MHLDLLGGFRLRLEDETVSLPTHAQRVMAYLSVSGVVRGGCTRAILAERLWTATDSERAQASLRTALWRIRQVNRRLLSAEQDSLRLGNGVHVDVNDTLAQASRLIGPDEALQDPDTRLPPLVSELLPDWDEDWLLLERERVRQLQLHGLDALAHRLRRLGRYGEAVNAALMAIAIEPLRESARSELIAAHLAEGNVAAAHRQFQDYAALLWTEVRLKPSPSLAARFAPGEQDRPGEPGSTRRQAS